MARVILQAATMHDTSDQPDTGHKPVMLNEVLDLLHCAPGGIYVDATLGMGGHALAIMDRIQPAGLLVGLDRDKESLEMTRLRL